MRIFRVRRMIGMAGILVGVLLFVGCKNPLVDEIIKVRADKVSPKMSLALETDGTVIGKAGAYSFGH